MSYALTPHTEKKQKWKKKQNIETCEADGFVESGETLLHMQLKC
jgi:hypothetical protein